MPKVSMEDLGIEIDKVLYTGSFDEDDSQIWLASLKGSDNLMLQQGHDDNYPVRVFLSWDELQELSKFYCGYMDKLEGELG